MRILSTLIFLLISNIALANPDIVGLWKTIDDETHEAKSIVRIYKHQDKYYGRVVELFKNKSAKAKIDGEPQILGLDIIWDLKEDGSKLNGGKILDPQKGKVYGCEIWREGEDLIVRGKIAFLGRNQTWKPVTNEELLSEDLTPNILIKD